MSDFAEPMFWREFDGRLQTLKEQVAHVMTIQHAGDLYYRRALETGLLLQGRMAAQRQGPSGMADDLAAVGFRVFSQWTEDGIVEWLVKRVPGIVPRFVEFGVENFLEANCRFLMMHRNWRGLVLDGSEANIVDLRAHPDYWRYALDARAAFVTRENINGLIDAGGISGEIGILSIDIDGNDYWIWEAIEVVSPTILICEFNTLLGDLYPICVPYDSAFRRFDAHYSGAYFGCSIMALQHLAGKKGYRFVGTGLHGVNAFFVRNDHADRVLTDLRHVRAYPARHRDGRDETGALSYRPLEEVAALIGELPVVDVVDGDIRPLVRFGALASRGWFCGEPMRLG
jgi:hypothetical protein